MCYMITETIDGNIFDVNSAQFKNCFSSFALRACWPLSLNPQVSEHQKAIECMYITFLRALEELLGLPISPDLSWIQMNGKEFIGELGFLIATGVSNSVCASGAQAPASPKGREIKPAIQCRPTPVLSDYSRPLASRRGRLWREHWANNSLCNFQL